MSRIFIVFLSLLLACGGKSTGGEDTSVSDEGMVEDTIAAVDEGLAPEDTTPMDPGAPADEGAPPIDTTVVEPDWNWTWLQCRQAYLAETLTDEDQTLCTEHYSQPATRHRFGIRWVFLGHDEETVATYPETQMVDLNDIYAENDMEFFIHSRLRIIDPVAVEGAQGDTKFTVSQFIGDIRQYLGTDEEDPQAVLDLFLAALAEKGVQASDKQGNGLQPRSTETTLDTEWTANDLHGRLSRLNNEFVTVIVRQAAGEKSWGNYPRSGNTAAVAGLVYLASVTPLSALPHEIGHYFGLPHTHGLWNKKPGSTQEWQAGTINGIQEETWSQLQALAGEDYDGDFQNSHVPFDSEEDGVLDLEKGQILARKVLAWAELTYVGDFMPVGSDAEFIEMIRSGAPPLMKNFVRENEEGGFTGNNCGKSYVGDDQTTLRCKYGDDGDDPLHILFGDAPVLFNTVLFVDSTESNMMSYINTDTSDGVRRKRHLTQRQWDLIRLGTRMPSRMRLRNYALFD
jgi:hypothetical protein